MNTDTLCQSINIPIDDFRTLKKIAKIFDFFCHKESRYLNIKSSSVTCRSKTWNTWMRWYECKQSYMKDARIRKINLYTIFRLSLKIIILSFAKKSLKWKLNHGFQLFLNKQYLWWQEPLMDWTTCVKNKKSHSNEALNLVHIRDKIFVQP